MRLLRPMLLTALAIGVFVGVIAALAIPRTRAAEQSAHQQLGPAGVLRTAPALRHPSGQGYIDLRLRGQTQIEARAKDPRGGPDWAVRVFNADRVVPADDRRPGVNPVIGHDLCAQLGRLYRERFGWLDATGTFRPIAIDTFGAPTTCGSRLPDLHGEPFVDIVIPITDPRRPEAHAKQLIAWGLAGSGAKTIQLRLGLTKSRVPRNAHGAFLAIGPPRLPSTDVAATITYAGGHTVHLPRQFHSHYPGSGEMVLSGRAPDPNGGLPYALLSNATCTQWGSRILDDNRFGDVDYRLDTFRDLRPSGGSACGSSPEQDAKAFRKYPVLLGYGGGDEPQAGSEPGRVARRTQRGSTVITGRVAPDVVAVTLETPRDVRTLIPGGPAHAIIAAYDGMFRTGAITVIARYKDGHTKTVRLPVIGL
jgi:hypothetical protein